MLMGVPASRRPGVPASRPPGGFMGASPGTKILLRSMLNDATDPGIRLFIWDGGTLIVWQGGATRRSA